VRAIADEGVVAEKEFVGGSLVGWLGCRDRGGGRSGGAQLGAKAADELGSEFGDFHAFGDDKFATENRAGLVVVRKLAHHFAILALLIPAKTAVGNRLGADELEGAEERIPLRDEERFPQNRDFNKLFVGPKYLRHERCSAFRHVNFPLGFKLKHRMAGSNTDGGEKCSMLQWRMEREDNDEWRVANSAGI
jgi:hypothetical protein